MPKRKTRKRMAAKVYQPPAGSCGSFGNRTPEKAPSLSRERARVSTALRGLPMPEAFVLGTIAAASLETYRDRPKQLRRLSDKVRKLTRGKG
jgi:hypothetical protein